jgi:hypothetical protein
MTMSTDHDETAGEKLFLEQAKAYYRDLRTAGLNASSGKGLQNAEAVALQFGKELVRQSLELAAQEGIEELEKKMRTASVNAAAGESIAGTRKDKRSAPSEK